VEFADFQCPFCRRVQKTLDEVRAKYGSDVRIVFKHNPLPFHDRAAPAAELAAEAYQQKGVAGFWAAAHALFEAPLEDLAEPGLLEIGAELALNAAKTRKALDEKTHEREVLADMDLAMDFNARGVPHFFINGRRLTGAQPYEKFAELIDAELAEAKAIVARGVAKRKVYDTILATAEGPAPPDVVDVSGVTRDRASRGPANAPVVVYEFADFQCPFCKRVQPTLETLQKEFPGKIRLAWVNLPLDFHQRARAAANAALAVRARAGDAAFWKMHDLLFESQPELSDERLADLAQRVGADPKYVLEAVQSGRYDAPIDEDREAAERAGIRGTPGFSVNGYFISGAQPLDAFRRIVKRALDDRKRGFVPKPNYKPPAAVATARPRISAHHILIFYQGSTRAPSTVTRNREQARALAAKLRQEILGGADFERVAKEYSEDPSAAYGGSLGSFDTETMVKPFSDAAFALKPGQVSDVVETPFGFHVIRRDE
jgi:protein-disulfide isomerase